LHVEKPGAATPLILPLSLKVILPLSLKGRGDAVAGFVLIATPPSRGVDAVLDLDR
jgi:hypothetical protein